MIVKRKVLIRMIVPKASGILLPGFLELMVMGCSLLEFLEKHKLYTMIVLFQMQIEEKQQQSQLKQKWFQFTKELASNEISMNFYKLFVIVQSLQFIAFHNNGLVKYKALGLEFLGKLFQYVNLYPLMLQQNVNIIFVPIFTVLTIVHIFIIILGFKAYHKKMELKNKSIEDRNFHKNKLEYFINLIMICFNTFLTIPICQTSVTSIYCLDSAPFTAKNGCYSSVQLSIAFFGIINLLWLLVSNIFFALYYYSRNPFSTSYLACSSHWWNLGKFGIKLVPVFYFAYDPVVAYPVLFLIMMNACFVGYIAFFRILFPYYRYNFDFQKFVHYVEDLTMMVNLSFVAIYAVQLGKQSTQNRSIILIFWLIGSLLLARLRLKYFISKKAELISQIHSTEKTKLQGVLQYLIYLIYQFQKGCKTNRLNFIGNLAKTHSQVCQRQECYCFLYFELAGEKGYINKKQSFYSIILAIVDRVIDQNKKAYSFIILKAYVLNYKMKSQIKAATTIAMIMQDKLDFSDETLVKGLLFQLDEQYVDTRDMQIYRKFNEFLLQQEEESMKLVNYYLQYWQQLIDQSSSIPKLHRLLNNIKHSKVQLQNIVQSSLDIFRNHVRVLLLYKNFLKEVLNDYMGYLKYEEKHKIGLKEHKLSNVDAANTIQFRPNQNLLVINFTRHFSAHSDIVGNFKIMSISSNVKDFLGFTNVELKGKSLNKLIPRIYQGVHDGYIDKILEKQDSDINARQIRIFPVNSMGHILQCNIISKFMPSLATGVNIVSFLEECDKCKDEYLIIYDSRNGVVDAMNEQADKTLKDASHRKRNDMLVIPDHINDLVPNWDYRNQVWRDNIVSRGKSLKSMNSLTEPKYDLREIQIVRSDGGENHIKVLKFKGDFFTRMFSFDNLQSYKQSNTIQQYLQYRKDKSYASMNSKQLQDLICVQTSKLIERTIEKKKTLKKLQKNEKTKVLTIDQDPPKHARNYFIFVQSILFCLTFGFLLYEFVVTNTNINTYFQDVKLLNQLNSVQSYLSDTTFILSLSVTNMAYTSNMSLPYPNFVSTISLQVQIKQMNEMYTSLNKIINQVNNILINKIKNQQMARDDIAVTVRYLNNSINRTFFQQKSDIVQAVLQHLQYGEQICYRIEQGKQGVQDLIKQASFYFIFANNIDVLPIELHSMKREMVQSMVGQLSQSYNVFIIIKVFNTIFLLLSALSIIVYYHYIYSHFIFPVLSLYQKIKISQIQVYQQKCKKYKVSLSDRTDMTEANESKAPAQSISQLSKTSQIQSPPPSQIVININEQEHKLLQKQEKEQEHEHFLNFEEMPKIWKKTWMLLIWICLYGLVLFFLLYNYSSGVTTLQFQIQKLNRYSNLQQSAIEIRLFSQLSLNMLDYWDQQAIANINSQLEEQFGIAVRSMDDKSLNTSAIRSQFASKYLELRYLQELVLSNNRTELSSIVNSVQSQLESMDDLINYLEELTVNYLPIVQADSEWIATQLNINISAELIFIILYWVVGVRLIYLALLREYENTYEMYSIISYNLRRQIEGDPH